MDELDSGLLGDLPRSRPGTRSPRRGDAAPKPARPSAPADRDSAGSPQAGDPLSVATRVIGGGLRAAGGAAGEILRRLPRP